MRRVLGTLAVLAALGLAGGGAIVFGGLYNVSAKLGHWPITRWVLGTTLENSVELWAPPPSAVPPLTEEMARLGARHFDGACRTCHGAPGESRSWTVRSMVPAPPPIQEAVAGWPPNELGWIVREGIKMSGMPQWPSTREDEVWNIVAFLTRVRDMDAATYAALTAPPAGAQDGPPGLGYCAGCHGLDGRSGNPYIPRLDIQEEDYLAQALASFLDRSREAYLDTQLRLWRAGNRGGGPRAELMQQAAEHLTDEEIAALAAYYASLSPVEGADEPE
jgi:cytochrome c553